GGLYDHRFDVSPPAVDEERRADRRHARRQIAEAHVLANGRGRAAARANAHLTAALISKRIPVPRDAASGHLEADELPRERGGLHLLERLFADELRLVELHHPTE